MPLTYKPLTEEQAYQQQNPYQPGIYKFRVAKVEEGKSKNNNHMIVVDLEVSNENINFTIKDFIPDAMAWKLRHLAKAVDKLQDYENNTLTELSLLNKEGQVRLDKDKNPNNEKSYLKVMDYMKPEETVQMQDDEVPF